MIHLNIGFPTAGIELYSCYCIAWLSSSLGWLTFVGTQLDFQERWLLVSINIGQEG